MTAALATMQRHGRTFRLAGALLGRHDLEAAAELYAFCREADDLADLSGDPAVARTTLLSLRRAVVARDPGHETAARLLRVRTRNQGAPGGGAAVVLLDTMLSDLGPVRMVDETALLRYAYGAAGTVGLMMCDVLGVQAEAARAHAIDLGIAMQLTNVARDVAEDARRDRLYLPATWLPPGLDPDRVLSCPVQVFAAVRRLLALAERHYRSAASGYGYLPTRSRPAVRVAGRLYREIGVRILAAGPGYLAASRCVVPRRRRLSLLLCEAPAGWLPGHRPGLHDPSLHLALSGLPGAAE